MQVRATVRAVLLFAVAVAASATAARATTVVVPTDDELAAASRAVVEARVAEIRTRRSGREITTYVALDVSRVLAGDATTGRLVLKQMGGVVGDDFTMVYGSPEYTVGERVVVFLNTDDEGAWHTAFMFLGKYSVVSKDGRDVVVRGNGGEGVLAIGGTTESAPYDDFVAAVRMRATAKRASGLVPAVAVPVELATRAAKGDESFPHAFTLMSDHTRWFEPDDGVVVPYKVNLTPFLPDGGAGAVTDALAAWSTVPGCSLRLALVDHTENCGFRNDGDNTVSFEDCHGQVDGGGCFGVIAVGGASGVLNEHRTINGVTFVRIKDADVVMNNGQTTCLLGHRLTLREILTHELGHTIGLGHSSEKGPEPDPRLAEATMYYQLHEDDRGASLKPDDVDGVTFIYPASELAPSVATDTLAAAEVAVPYAATLAATNGAAPLSWAVTAGALPDGISLSADDGALSGMPAARGTSTFTVTVTDARGRSASRELSLDVTGPKPVVAGATYKAGKKLTALAELHGATSVEVWVNGVRVSPPARVKLRARGTATQITLKGTAADLNVTQPAGSNSLVVVADGAASDPRSF